MIRTASARYEGLGKDGKGHVSTQSGVLDAKANCPISKLLKAEITLTHRLT